MEIIQLLLTEVLGVRLSNKHSFSQIGRIRIVIKQAIFLFMASFDFRNFLLAKTENINISFLLSGIVYNARELRLLPTARFS